MNRALSDALEEFESDASARAAILTGEGSHFCAGADDLPENEVPRGLCGLTGRAGRSKPLIAAVEGKAHTEGFELALACDMIIAGEGATFAMDHAYRGRTARYGGPERIASEIPRKRAMGIVLGGEPVTAAEGVILGFVNDLADSGRALEQSQAWAERLLERSPAYVAAVKRAVDQAFSGRAGKA